MPHWMDALNALGTPLAPRGAIQGLQESFTPGGSAPLPKAKVNPWLAALGLPDEIVDVPDALGDLAGLSLGDVPEALGGAAAGALEGLRSLTSPAAIAGALPLVGMGGKALGFGSRAAGAGAGLLDDVARGAGRTLDVVEDIPTRQVMPSADDVAATIGDSRRQMARVPQATGQYRHPSGGSLEGMASRTGAPTRGPQLPPEFVPRGGEGAYNMGRPRGVPQGVDLSMPPPMPRYRR